MCVLLAPNHIVDGEVTEIEALVWSIIMHYGISMSSEWDNSVTKGESNETSHHK